MPPLAVKVILVPEQNMLSGSELISPGIGKPVTETKVVAVPEHPLLLVTVMIYEPAIASEAFADTTGLCIVLVNPLGPVHE